MPPDGGGRTGLVALGLALLALTAARPAAADPGDEVIGMLDVRVIGLGETAGELLTRDLADAVGRAGYIVVLPARLREAMATTSWNTACVIGACLQELERQAAVRLVLHAALYSVGANHDYVVTLLDTVHGVPVGQLQRTCEVCTTEEAMAATAAAAVELVIQSAGRAPEPIADRPVSAPPAPPVRHRPAPLRLRRTAVMLVTSAVVVGAGGYYLRRTDHPGLGAGALGAAATLGLAGGYALAISFDF